MWVFVENEAGSRVKHHHDEKTLEHRGTEVVALPYPYPYGFVIGTTAGDGDNVDCFVLTSGPLRTGDVVECVAVALLEQVEAGAVDHNVLAVPGGEPAVLPSDAEARVREFVGGFRRHQPGVASVAGRLLGRAEAEAYVESCRDG